MEEPGQLLATLAAGLRRGGDLVVEVPAFLVRHGRPKTAEHSLAVAAEARWLAERFGVDSRASEHAGLLHDVSAVVPNGRRVEVARWLGIEPLPEEIAYPMIVHQRLSAALADELFGVVDAAVLDAIGCHTTLRAGATPLDRAVFIADKLAWDQGGTPPYFTDLSAALDVSLDAAAAWFVRYLWDRRRSLLVVHPWLAAAHAELEGMG